MIIHGRIALELYTANSGPHVLDTADEGEVLDWPWLIPPHRWFFDARASEPTRVVSLESACLRRKCADDPRLGYQFVLRVAQVMSHRLQATRVRLPDLYGDPQPPWPGPLVSAANEPSEASADGPVTPADLGHQDDLA